MSNRWKIALIIPAHNEAERLDFEATEIFLEKVPSATLFFVDDASTDGTWDLLVNYAASTAFPDRVRKMRLTQNVGKGETVRAGVLEALQNETYDFIGFWDADLATPFSEVEYLLDSFVEQPHLDAVFGIRCKRLGSSVQRRASRHAIGRVIATWTVCYLKLPMYDTQCGAKIFRSKIAAQVFSQPFLTKWFFDVEIIKLMTRIYSVEWVMEHVLEKPLRCWQDIPGSKIGLSSAPTVLLEILRLSGTRF